MLLVLCPVPSLLTAEHLYCPASPSTALTIVKDGVSGVLPLYLFVSVLEVILVSVFVYLVQKTDVIVL